MYKLKVTITLFAAFASVSCYDFQDSYYNDALASALESTRYSIIQGSRAKRDVSSERNCGNRNHFPQACCNVRLLENQLHQFKENRKECFLEIYGKNNFEQFEASPDRFRCENVHHHRNNMTCFVQCLAEKTNLVDFKGDIKEAQFAGWARDSFKESWIVAHFDTVIPKCAAEARMASATYSEKQDPACNPSTLKMVHCLFREIQMNCPEEEINDINTCGKFRETVRKYQMRRLSIQDKNNAIDHKEE